MLKKFFLTAFFAGAAILSASDIGVVNFTNCIMESKYGKNEQGQLESIKQQWSSVIEQTEKDLKDVAGKLNDQNYMEGLSTDAASKLKDKYKTLNEDMAKYQNQLYQVMNQANYIFVQKMIGYINKASEEIAAQKKFSMVVNKEACFYHKNDLDITRSIISVMDKNYEKEKKISEAKEKEEKAQKESKTAAKAPAVKNAKTAKAPAAKAPGKAVKK